MATLIFLFHYTDVDNPLYWCRQHKINIHWYHTDSDVFLQLSTYVNFHHRPKITIKSCFPNIQLYMKQFYTVRSCMMSIWGKLKPSYDNAKLNCIMPSSCLREINVIFFFLNQLLSLRQMLSSNFYRSYFRENLMQMLGPNMSY